MGIFSKLTGNQAKAAKLAKSSDEQLLFHAIICMAAADGELQDAELATVEAFFLSIPEFRGLDFQALLDHTSELFDTHGGVAESVSELAAIESVAVRKKAFVLSVDVALASGEVAESEDQMLDVMQRILEIDDQFAGKVIEVLFAKYDR